MVSKMNVDDVGGDEKRDEAKAVSKMNVDDVGGDEKRDESKAPISPDPKPKPKPEPETEVSTPPKVTEDEDGDKENASLNSNRQTPTAVTPGSLASPLPDCEIPEVVASPLRVTAYFNELSAYLVRSRISVDEYAYLREKVDEVLKKCGY